MAQGERRTEQFLAWAKATDPLVRVADWRRVVLELFERSAGGPVAAEHVDELVAYYRRALLGPQKIIMAADVGEQLIAWQRTAPPEPGQEEPERASSPGAGFSPPSSPGAGFSPPSSPGAGFSPPVSEEGFSPYSPPTPLPRRAVPSAPPEPDPGFSPATSPGMGMPFNPGSGPPRVSRSRAPETPPEDNARRKSEDAKARHRSRSGTLAETLELNQEMDDLELELDLDGKQVGAKPK